MGTIKEETRVQNAIDAFNFQGEQLAWIPYGNGHINDTYKVDFSEKNYILQRINHHTFKDPESLVKNIEYVTKHIKEKMPEGSNFDREVLQLISLKNDNSYLFNDEYGNYWRAYLFVEDSVSFDQVENKEQFYESAYAFGLFQYYLSDFDATVLSETIKDFHNTPVRLQNLKDAIEKDPLDRLKNVEEEVNFALERSEFTHLFTQLFQEGTLKKRVTHNDTKLNNVLLDKDNHKALCVIDLDTVMPGFVLDDFGDSIRFGASTGLEDEKDLSKITIDLDLYEAYIQGFLKGAQNKIENTEIELFPEASKMMTLECGMRFLTDYLLGDTYFKTHYDDHNLVRTRTQFKLVAEMENQWEQMKTITHKYLQ
ncbi:phosphotransferase enzyme family protein [Erysipelothrix urinaevulpis]|uniref:phosphotransferase enzyme family protein n=1 Tax=Erysipelothrix urinaevulpis TaxID=2683717 RepID=UPI00135677D8|nr:phosphotransferase [Erysipelothrix urinaevulpis]